MKTTCKNNFLQRIIKIKQKAENISCCEAILILDDKTTKILSQIVSVDNLLDNGIKYMTKISLTKKPEANAIGIYYLSQKSIMQIQKDFDKKPTYFSVNILVCEQISQQTLKYVSNKQKIIQRLATFQQFQFPIKYLSEQIALFDSHQNYLKSVYQQITYISEQLGEKVFAGIMSSFSKLTNIQLYYSDESKFSIMMANRTFNSFNSYIKNKQSTIKQLQNQQQMSKISLNNKNKSINQQQNQLKVIFFDRNIDYVSPIVRNYYYFPMICDLFDVKDFKNLTINKLNINTQKEINLQYDDKVFLDYKNKHISQAFTQISGDLQKFSSTNKAAKFQKDRQSPTKNDNKNLKQVIKQYPEYTKRIKSYNQHIQIMKQLSVRSKREKLTQIGELQMLIITSLTSQAEVEKDKKIYKKTLDYLQHVVDNQIKARFIYLMLQCLQISQKQKQQLITHFEKIPAYEGFGLLFDRQTTGKLRFNPLHKKQSLYLDRHQCIIAKRCQQIIQGKPNKEFKKTLSLTQFIQQNQQVQKNIEKRQKQNTHCYDRWIINQ